MTPLPRPNPNLLSFVIPVYNEVAVIPTLRFRMTAFLESVPFSAEIILIDDGSTDQTLQMLLDWANQDQRIRVLGLARNFGQQAAITAGLDAAGGDAVVVIDADLQDPPEIVREMIGQYRLGYDVVYGQRIARDGESFFKRLSAWLFYRFMRQFVHRNLPPDTGDFRLISRECLNALKAMRETHRFLRGMVAWVGFPQTAVQYQRAPRSAGETKFPLHKMIHFAWTAAVSFSPLPLQLSLGAGFFVALFGLGYGAYVIVRVLSGGWTEKGWASLVVLICLIGGSILMGIGLLGEYVGRIFEEVKGRPLYVVSRTANMGQQNSQDASVAVRSSDTGTTVDTL